ncbi:MAG: hypothetical protein LBR26_12940 [Prevotella sp.]|jgi:hypothetical protein|nr:hypothetical protein [Prevotella sp.]
MRLLFLAIVALCVSPSYSQESTDQKDSVILSDSLVADVAETAEIVNKQSNKAFLSHLSVAVRASTMGVGLQVATPINDYLKLRAGIDFAGYKTSAFNIDLSDPDGVFNTSFGYVPQYRMDGELNFTNGNILVDFHPTKGIFHFTAGVFIGTNQLKARGFLVDSKGDRVKLKEGVTKWPEIDFEGYQLILDNANLDATLQLGKTIKPYFGLGLGRSIANKRVAFKFELGMIYQGDYSIKQNGKEVKIVENVSENFEDIGDYTKWLKWWPMLNFQLSYKIF